MILKFSYENLKAAAPRYQFTIYPSGFMMRSPVLTLGHMNHACILGSLDSYGIFHVTFQRGTLSEEAVAALEAWMRSDEAVDYAWEFPRDSGKTYTFYHGEERIAYIAAYLRRALRKST